MPSIGTYPFLVQMVFKSDWITADFWPRPQTVGGSLKFISPIICKGHYSKMAEGNSYASHHAQNIITGNAKHDVRPM